MRNVLCIGTGDTGKAIIKSLSGKKDIENIYVKNKSGEIPVLPENSPHIQLFKATYSKKIDTVLFVPSAMPIQERARLYNTSTHLDDFRTPEWKYNKDLLIEHIPLLQPLYHSKIIIITNPVDTIVNFLNCELGRKDILGYGMTLDRKRVCTSTTYKSHEEHHMKNPQIPIWGKHGYPLPIINTKRQFYEALYYEINKATLDYIRMHSIGTETITEDFSDFITTLSSPAPTLVDLCHHQNILKECPNMALSGQFLVQNMNIIKAIPPQLNRDESLLLTEIGKSIQAPLKK